MFWLEFAVVIGMLVFGVRYGGIFLGMAGGVSLAVLTFVFHLTPSSPPIDVMLIIMTVVVTTAALQAAGGMEYLVSIAEKMLRKNPKNISFVAPFVSYLFTFMAGTGNVAFSIIPVIAEVSREAGIRPERPLSISIIASQQAITACPISAATVAMVGLLSPFNISLIDILSICIPSTLIGVFGGALYASRVGKELSEDEEYLARVKSGEAPPISVKKETVEKQFSKEAKRSVALFLSAALLVVLFGLFPFLRPELNYGGKMIALSMTNAIEIVMMVMGAAMVAFCKIKTDRILEMSVFKQGMMGVFCIFGLAWAGDTLVANNLGLIKGGVQEIVQSSPWVFALALFAVSALILSQAATVRALMPLGIALGIPASALVGMFPAVNGYFFVPSYATILAGVAFDRTKTTRIGKYVFNHSYMIPGLITTILSVSSGLLIASIIL